MALSEFERERVTRLLSSYCESKLPQHVSDCFRVEFDIRGNDVKLFESRPHWMDRNKWTSHKVALFRKEEKTNVWRLYYPDRNGRWHIFEPVPEDKDIEKLLAEVERDPSGIFWG